MSTENSTPEAAQQANCVNLDQIAMKAYTIWQEQGCPSGRDFDHWIEAEAHYRKCLEEEARQENQAEA